MTHLSRAARRAGGFFAAALVLAAPAFAQTGTLSGVVVDGDFNNETLPGANVQVVGTSLGIATALDGTYRLALAPGTYDVRYSFAGYDAQTVTGIAIAAGETTEINVTLGSTTLGELTVEAEAIIATNSEVGLDRLRARSAAVSDAISAEAISRSASSDAADAMERVTGATVQGGQYVFVRGLGDRYANTQLNGAILPTADPDRRAVQFDLFPSSFLDNIVTLKTFTPDKPGSFSGGLVDITTKSFPSEFSSSLSLSTGFSSAAPVGGDFLVDPVQGAGLFRFGAGDLELPALLAGTDRASFVTPTTRLDGSDGPGTGPLVREDAAAAARLNDLSNALTPRIAPSEGTVPFAGSFGFSLGDQVDVGGNSLGFILGLNGGTGASYYDSGTVGRVDITGRNDETGVISADTTQFRTDRRGVQDATLGGIANLAYRLGSFGEISLNTLFSHTTESEARTLDGVDNVLGEGTPVVDIVSGYTERTLRSGQLRGEHAFPSLGGLELAWRGSLSRTALDEPDLRQAAIKTSVFEIEDDETGETSTETSFSLVGTPPGPQRYFRDLSETLAGGGLDLTLPFRVFGGGAQLKAGGLLERTDRGYGERFYVYELDRSVALGGTSADSMAAYLGPDNVGVVDTQVNGEGEVTRYVFGHFLRDNTRDVNNYDGAFDVNAGYGMLELPLGRLRAIAGVRYENSTLFVASGQQIAEGDSTTAADNIVDFGDERRLGSDKSYNDVLPALNLVYGLTESMNLRAAATRTLARPTFREIAPVTTFDFTSDGALVGNPELERTLITNLDLRWEWFNRPGQILAVSGYYKRLSNPIERVIIDAENGSTTYANVNQADVFGAEFEARQTLGALGFAGALADRLSLGANLTLAQSSITITERELEARRALNPDASDTRDLQGQSPYVVNASLAYDDEVTGFSAGAFFNVAGPRLSRVGTTLDVYERPLPQLDLTLSKELFGQVTLKGSVKNALGASYREAYDVSGFDLGGPTELIPFLEYNRGTSFSLGLSVNPSFGGAVPAVPPPPTTSTSPAGPLN